MIEDQRSFAIAQRAFHEGRQQIRIGMGTSLRGTCLQAVAHDFG
jgi:hypothetical protein